MITAYPVAGKAKSYDICEAFVQGCGGAIALNAIEPRKGTAFFYGVDESNIAVWKAVQKTKWGETPFYYCDNAYFDSTRQEYFRVSYNRLQHRGEGTSNGERFKALNIEIKPWTETGKHIVVCPQSDHFMKTVVGFNGDWLTETLGILKGLYPDRELRVRAWNRDKGKLAATLGDDLKNAYCLVTWSSAAAITAILHGIPIICGSNDCAAITMSGHLINADPLPRRPRETWAGVLADNQWTLDEFRQGIAWKALNV